MRGTVIRRGKKWSFVIDVGYNENGKRIRRWHSGFDLKKQAQKELNATLARLQSGTYVAPSKVTVGQYLKDWLIQKEPTLAANTLKAYQVSVRQITKAFETRRLQSLTPQEINFFYASETARGLSGKSIKNHHGVLRKSLRDAEKWGVIQRNPAALADPPKVRPPEPRVWTAAQLRTFLGNVAEDRRYGAWALAATTGVRRSELLGLGWSNVDLEHKRITIVDTLIKVGQEVRLRRFEAKTRASRRSVALDGSTVEVLRTRRRRQVEERLRAGELWDDHGLVFCDEIGRPYHPDRFSRQTKVRVARAGVPWIGVHGRRHTHATLALRAGISPKIVQERLGHSNVALTLQVYSHVLPGMSEEAAEVIAEQVFG